MPGLLRLLPVALPAAEIVILIVVADQIGIGWTLLALAASALAGILVIRVLGAASLSQLGDTLARHEPPAGPLFRGACVLIAGMLLILPGFLSDVVALLLLIPPTRNALTGALWRHGAWRYVQRDAPWSNTSGPTAYGGSGPTVIDGDYHEVPPDPATPPDRRLGQGDEPTDPRPTDPRP
jgi:UPF0716 protein FxsA